MKDFITITLLTALIINLFTSVVEAHRGSGRRCLTNNTTCQVVK